MTALATKTGIAQADLARLELLLRQQLASRDLRLVSPGKGQTVQVHVGELPLGTVDLDDDGDFVITLVVLRDELPTR